MSINSDQATEASIFLTLYQQAITTLKISAIRDHDNEIIEDFTNRINQIYSSKIFRKICNPWDPNINHNNSQKHIQLVKDVRTFQYSHYIFAKYLPDFLNFKGSGETLIPYLKQQNDRLQKDVEEY